MSQIDLVTPNWVADKLEVTTKTLAVWRCEGRYNLPYIKVGRLVRYRRSDVLAFLASRTRTQQPGAATARA